MSEVFLTFRDQLASLARVSMRWAVKPSTIEFVGQIHKTIPSCLKRSLNLPNNTSAEHWQQRMPAVQNTDSSPHQTTFSFS
jgi:hypothetical protein